MISKRKLFMTSAICFTLATRQFVVRTRLFGLIIAVSALHLAACQSVEQPIVQLESALQVARNALGTGSVQYAYDAAGRLVTAQDGNSNLVEYRYDASGNILSVLHNGNSIPMLFDVMPTSAVIGDTITITGIGLSATAASNLVQFTGANSNATTATTQRIQAVVPVNTTTGPIKVVVGGKAISNSLPLTILSNGPKITDFTPKMGNSNTVVQVTGTNFSTNRSENVAWIGAQIAQVGNVTSTSMAIYPSHASGKIEIATGQGLALSAQDFYYIPSGVSQGNVICTSRLTIDGNTTSCNLKESPQTALFLFDANQGDHPHIDLFDVGTEYTLSAQIFDATGLSWISTYFGTVGNMGFDLTKVPSSGTYLLMLQAFQSRSGNSNLRFGLSSPKTGNITVNGATLTFSPQQTWQSGYYQFYVPDSDTNIAFEFFNNTFTKQAETVELLGQSEKDTIFSKYIGPGSTAHVKVKSLPAGYYTLHISASDHIEAANMSFYAKSFAQDVKANLVASTSSTAYSLNQNIYQDGNYSFSAMAGDYIGMAAFDIVTNPGSSMVTFDIYDPNNTYIGGNVIDGNGSFYTGDLPSTGVYRLLVSTFFSSTPSSTTGKVLLTPAWRGALTLSGSAVTFSASRPGQPAIYTFQTNQTKDVTVTASGCTFNGIIGDVYSSSGSYVDFLYFTSGSASSHTISNLPPGAYRIIFKPSSIETGSISISVK